MDVLPTLADQILPTLTLSAVSLTSVLRAVVTFGLPAKSTTSVR
jgi:hypothetical protein